MKKMKQKFPIGTLVKAIIPRVSERPYELLGLVISHVDYECTLLGTNEDRCEVWFGPNPWVSSQIVEVQAGRLISISRAYKKEFR